MILFNYLVFGVITTVINILSYAILTKSFYVDFKTATTIAWILSVFFAFFSNKYYVFKQRNKHIAVILKELRSFFFSRILSYGLDLFSMVLLIELLHFKDLVAKVIANILVIAFNYFASKYFIFKQHLESDTK